ncbi:MAG: protein kinase [Chloroflexota bacterium]
MDIGALINDQYKVIEHIGRGGMADVWSARDTRLRRMVAIKTILSGFGQDIDPVALFRREAQTIAALEHPHILPIHDFGEHDGSLYIAMRYVTGGSLEEELRDGPMPPQEALHMAHDIGRALDYAHDNNVIHLDLKPPNILLDSSGSPYLADFGLATVLDAQGRAQNPGSGTLLYMAPEQIISETIDHRADIYAFSIMLFHMLTGKLPFDGGNPLAMAQMQLDDNLPDVEDYVTGLPSGLSDLLRRGTAQDPNHRPSTHAEFVEQFREILQPTGIAVDASGLGMDDSFMSDADLYNMQTELYDADMDANLLEAVDLYSRARVNWQGGQGRFLLGITHFLLMSEYYQNADDYGLSIDREGYQMLLRGALEYDYELEYWWHQVNDDDRRWVCLHALRSGNTPARIRALYRLETLPDEEGTMIIPRLVTQALEVESDDQAKIAALHVLGTRARIINRKPSVNIMTEFRGRLLTSMTRLGIEIRPPADWSPQVYSRDVDVLVAEQAFDPSEDVAEFAARTVGKMRSLAAIEHLAHEQENGREGALEALALVRDEAPALPDVVSREGRFYAWITNTVRRLTENPNEMILRLLLVFFAGWIAMGNHIWSYYRVGVGTLSNARWANSLGFGISFGLLMALTYLVTKEISRRLDGFWSWWMRLLLTGTLGFILGMISFASFRFLFMQEPTISILWDEMRFVGAGMALGLVASSLLKLRSWQGVLLTTLTTFTPIYATYRAYYFANESTIVPLAVLALGLGMFAGWRATKLTDFNPRRLEILERKFMPIIIGSALGFVWVALIWWQFARVYNQILMTETVSWDFALNLMGFSFVFGLLPIYWLTRTGRLAFALASVGSFVAVYIAYGWVFFDHSYSLLLTSTIAPDFITYYDGTPLLPTTLQPIFNYDDLSQIFKVTLPTIIVLAIGVNLPELLSGWWNWVGEPRQSAERGAWLTSTLLYVMILTGLVSLLALYSPGTNRLWELAWSGWAFVTFVFAIATHRRAKWGARALLYSGLLVIVGGFAFDMVMLYTQTSEGSTPILLSPMPQVGTWITALTSAIALTQLQFWSLWTVVLGVFVWGAQRRNLWGGIGIVAMLIGWYILFITVPMHASIAVFAITNVALVAFVLLDTYEEMETNRFQFSFATVTPTMPTSTDTQRDERDTYQPAAATEIVPDTPIASGNDILATHVAPTKEAEPDPLDTSAMPVKKAQSEESESAQYDLETMPPVDFDEEVMQTRTMDDVAQQTKPQKGMGLKLDTSALSKPKSDETTTPETQGVSIRLDTSALSKPKQKEDEAPSSGETQGVSIKLDTSAISKPKQDDTRSSSGETQGVSLKLDTSALSKPKQNKNSDDEGDNKSSDEDSSDD